MDEASELNEAPDLERAGRAREAEALYRAQARALPDQAAPREQLARLLANRGRDREALEELRRASRLQGRTPTGDIVLGSILRRRGRPELAEAAFLRAARAAAGVPRLASWSLLALGELREGLGRQGDARDCYERALAEDGGCAAAACGLGRLRRAGGDAAGAAACFERALSLDAGLHEARAGLAECLAQTGREAEALAQARALLEDPAAPANLAADCAGTLAARGLGPALQDALLARVRRRGGGGWDRVFCAQLSARRYEEAFALGEAAIGSFAREAAPMELSGLLWPWRGEVRRSVAEAEFCARRLEELAALRVEPWTSFLRCLLLIALDRGDDALALRPALEAAPRERFFWMALPLGLLELSRGRWAAAARDLEAVLERRPDLWWARCRLAEARLCRGDEEGARRELRLAQRLASRARDREALREVLTWRGEVLLWLGDYGAAGRTLDRAVALGATTFVFGWRGAARLKLGETALALADLDRAVAADRKDVEALVWRGEALRLAGRPREAAAELTEALRLSGGGQLWAAVNRALARWALGDEAGAREDFGRLPPEVAAAFLRRAGLPDAGAPGGAELARALEAALTAAKGVRRVESYLRPLWLAEPTPS